MPSASRTARDVAWTPFAGVRLQPVPDGALVSAPHLPEPRMLADLVEVEADGRFVLRGRQADMIEIAGKRASLADLTRRLLAIDGVRDGVVCQLAVPDAQGVRRIAAAVVADDALDDGALLDALRALYDGIDDFDVQIEGGTVQVFFQEGKYTLNLTDESRKAVVSGLVGVQDKSQAGQLPLSW